MEYSIVTPSFKQLDWLRLCVASVRDQAGTSRDAGIGNSPATPIFIEHLIQDAGSPGIEDFAKEMGADLYRDGQLVLAGGCEIIEGVSSSQIPTTSSAFPGYHLAIYSESDAGMYDAINKGFSKATGDIIAYLNCDEQYLPGALTAVTERFTSEPTLEMLFADAVVVRDDGEFLCFRKAQIPFKDQLWFRMPVLSCATFAQRSTFAGKKICVDETKKVLGDVLWIMRAQKAGVRMGVLRRFTSIFTETDANLGIGGAADREFLELRSRMPTSVRKFLGFYEAWHKIRSLISGTRWQRPFDYEAYTLVNPSVRRVFHVASPTAVWHGRTAIDKKVLAETKNS